MSRSRRALAGAVLLDFAVSPLFIWGALTAALSQELDVAEKDLTSVFSVGLATFTVGVLAGGRLADTVAPRQLALVAGAGVCAGLGTSAVAPSVAALTVGYGLLLGGAAGIGYATAVRVAGTVSTHRGGSIAAVVSAYAAGAVVLAPVADRLLVLVGRTGTFLALAAGMLLLLMLASALLPGAAPSALARPTAPRDLVHGGGRVPALWLMFLLGSAPALVAFAHPSQFLDDPGWAVLAVALLSGGNLAGRLLSGPVADRFGLPSTLHVTTAALTVACAGLAVTGTTGVVLAAYLVLGAQYGALSVLTPLATAALVPARVFGRAYGKVFTGWGAAGLAGPLAAAWLADGRSYRLVAGALLGVAVLGWFAVLLVQAVGGHNPEANGPKATRL